MDRDAAKPTMRVSDGNGAHQVPKRTWAQELSLWNGVADTNLLKMFIRFVTSNRDVNPDLVLIGE